MSLAKPIGFQKAKGRAAVLFPIGFVARRRGRARNRVSFEEFAAVERGLRRNHHGRPGPGQNMSEP